MTVALEEQALPPFAIDYVEQCLLDGNALAKAVLEVVPLREGRVLTCLPKGVAPTSLQDFRTGGKLPPPPVSEWRHIERQDETLLMIPVSPTNDWLVEHIKRFLRGGAKRICVFEDALKRVGDPVLHDLSTRYATFGKEIYHLILDSDAEDERILKVMRSARSVPTFIGALTRWRGELPTSHRISLAPATIHALAQAVDKLVIGAFDGEGYLIWNKAIS